MPLKLTVLTFVKKQLHGNFTVWKEKRDRARLSVLRHALNALVLHGLFSNSANYEIVHAEDLPLGFDALNDMPDGVEVRPYIRAVG